MSKPTTLLILVLGIFLFQIANLTYWARFQLWNPSSVVNLGERTLQDPQVRQVFSQTILEKFSAESDPLDLKTQKALAAAVDGILQSPMMKGVLNLIAQALFKALNSRVSEGVTIDLQPLKQDILAILKNFNQGTAMAQKLEAIPNQVILIEAGRIPPLYKISPTLFWIFIGSTLSALTLFALAIFKGKNRCFSLKWLGGLLILTSLMVYASLYLIRESILSYANTPNLEILAKAIFNALTHPLKIQLWVLISIALGIWLGLFFQRRGLKRLNKKIES